jgi:hypothetical protein
LLAFVAATAVAACVEIATGPGGVVSIRLVAVNPSIIVGDSLRDSTGNVAHLRAFAFTETGDTAKDAPFRFSALPVTSDTTTAARALLLNVDSLSGAVKALTPTALPARARLAVRLGDRLQVIDTIVIVPKPQRLARATTNGDSVRRLDFICDQPDTARAGAPAVVAGSKFYPETLFVGNTSTPLATLLTATSDTTTKPIPSYLVKYEIVSPTNIPSVKLSNGVTRRAIDIIDGQFDSRLTFDTTDVTGVAAPRLRIIPSALVKPDFPNATTPVVVRALVRTSPKDTVATPVLFTINLRRLSVGFGSGEAIACAQ